MAYTVQIDKLGAAFLDGATGLGAVTPVQGDDIIQVTIPDGTNFGAFDPGELVMLPNVPFLLLGVSIVAAVTPFTGGTIRLVGPQASGGSAVNRKAFSLLALGGSSGIVQTPQLMPFEHILSFTTVDAGPYRIIITLEPFRGADLPPAWVAGTLST